MIKEKSVKRRAANYAETVISALTADGPKAMLWAAAKNLIEAAYFNGFQSGVCWQKDVKKKKPAVR